MSDVEELYCPLSDEELAAKSQEMALALETVATLELEAKASAKQYGEALRDTRKKALTLARCVSAKQEKRKVPVSDRKNYRTFTVETVRHDTYEVIGVRNMTSEEALDARQGSLFSKQPDHDVPPAHDGPPAEGGEAGAINVAGEPVAEGADREDAPVAAESGIVPREDGDEEGPGSFAPGAGGIAEDPADAAALAEGTEISPNAELLNAAEKAAKATTEPTAHPAVRRRSTAANAGH